MEYKTSFTPLVSEPLPTKTVNGLTLVWSPEDCRYVLPLPEPEKARFKILLDEPTGNFVQVMINNPDFFYRDRTVTSPDGATYQEKIFIGKTPQGEPIELPDPKVQIAINQARKLELKRLFIENLIAAQGAVYLGLMVSAVFFFWYLITGLKVVAASFTTGSLLAMHEVGYYFAWIAGTLIGAFFLRFLIPILFSSRTPAEQEMSLPGAVNSGNTGGDTSINININQSSGPTSGAQNFINNRDL